MAMTVEQAKRWVEEAEKKDIHDISWEELIEVITVLRPLSPLGHQRAWFNKALDLVHMKAAPWLMNARAGDTSQKTLENLLGAARAVRASASPTGKLKQVDRAFLEEVGRLATRLQRAQPRRGKGPRADEFKEKRRRAEFEYRKLKAAFFDTGRRAGLSKEELEEEWTRTEKLAEHLGETIESAAAAKIAEWEAAILEALGDPIGPPGIKLPRGWTAVREIQMHTMGPGGPQDGTTLAEFPARYYADDALVAPVPTEQIPELQEAFIAAGLLEEGSFWSGVWDAETIKAYTTVLGYANLWGMTWDSALQRIQQAHAKLQQDQENKKTVSEIIAETYVQPDYATLAQEVKSMFRQRLRREPTEQELAELTAALGGWYRASFDVQMQIAEEAEARAESGSDEPIQAQDVDPVARLGELFDERFGAEERRFEQIDNVRENMTHMFQSLRSLQTMMGS
ncbi:MAG UNVERIFIED_CONTAM: hypothetical protein LOD86_04590 [Thermobifida fusca]